ncbi:MAG: hypothetical protein NDI95_01915 [Acidovorax soli]|uniref:hypothetical protein n=1 Tax=Acidovorax soli TaxID=592050 RepID=UPI0026F364F0|nr:hypothetical protein [Acidovorax soli]MCM2345396.1 hypothetical protein [Acidovorax soli]
MLARSPVEHVSVCSDCGVVHLSMDCLSVRLEVNAFLALAEMLSQAQKRLNGMQPHEGHACHESAHVVH